MKPMKHSAPKAHLYPKSHLLAASGVAAVLSLALLVFPSREVEAKKTFINLEMESAAELVLDAQPEITSVESPFLELPNTDALSSEASTPDVTPEATNPRLRQVTVASGDTLSTVFEKVELPNSLVHELVNSSKDARQFTRLNVGQVLDFHFTEDGQFERLSSQLNKLESIEVARNEQGQLKFNKELVKPKVQTQYAQGVIDSSLFLAARKAGLNHSLTMELANVFGYDIDFAMDIRHGDRFEVIFEEKTVDGERVGTGEILAARFINRGKEFTAVRYTSKQGGTTYYTADGNSMRRAFIRTPVDFARISSRFSNGRKHPILNKIRAHKGVDYAAPRGTPIKASGDGRIIFAGRKGGYGNTIVIQHGQRYRTLYAHMNGFASNMRNGSNVRQGQVIGYIGTTGLSTGPHLHYEFQVNGVHVDPLSERLPMADPIAKNERQRFLQVSQPLMARMDQERKTFLAMNKN